jgi:hypothetical protein
MAATDTDWQISPRYSKSKWDTGKLDVIDVFEDQIRGWLLEFAKDLASQKHGGLATLMVCCSLLERLESTEQQASSKNQSNDFFAAHATKVFQISESEAKDLCNALQNGLYHEALIRRGLDLDSNAQRALTVESVEGQPKPIIVINPQKFVGKLEEHFAGWIATTRKDQDRLNYLESLLPEQQTPSQTVTPQPSYVRLGTSTRNE